VEEVGSSAGRAVLPEPTESRQHVFNDMSAFKDVCVFKDIMQHMRLNRQNNIFFLIYICIYMYVYIYIYIYIDR
jgi:hypothetical protein